MKSLFFPVLLIFSLLFSFTSCDPDPVETDPLPGAVKIDFTHDVAGSVLNLDNYEYTSPLGAEYKVNNNKYYLSRINLIGTDGSVNELAMVHLVDIHDAASLSLTIADVPAGEYNSLSFTFGLTHVDNDQSILENTVENQNMYWPAMLTGENLPAGYHYMKYEGKYKLNTGEEKNFNLHLGPSFGNDNSFVVDLPLSKEVSIDDNTINMSINCDLQEWLQNPNTYDYTIYGQSIMPQQLAQEELKANGSTVFSVEL